MVRTQISLTEEQAERLKRVARERGVSMAAVIRDAVDAVVPEVDPAREEKIRRALAAVGSFAGGGGNVAEEHDRYLEEAYLDWRSS
ncbi:MAG: ribbon-helix-helix protein, CopG family [Actinobacteria bacterium]|nr:ribbon-helix-helix protein, CopG family [Actinomycetota bacterium]